MADRFGSISISDDGTDTETTSPSIPKKKKVNRTLKKKRQRKKLNKSTQLLLIFVVLPFSLLGLYCLGGFFILPKYLEEKATDLLAEKYQVQTELGKVQFNPFTFELTIDDFTVLAPESDKQNEKLVTIHRITTTLSPIEIIRNNLVLNSLHIETPVITVSRFKDNEYNFSQYLQTTNTDTPQEILDFAELPFHYSINNFTVNNGQVLFNDKPSGKIHTVESLKAGIPSLANFEYTTPITVESQFSAVINGSPFEISAQKNGAENGTNSFSVDLQDLNLPVYVDYLPLTLPVEITEGTVQGKLNIVFGSQSDDKIKLSFQLDLNDVSAETKDKNLSLKAGTTQLIGDFNPLSGAIFFDNVYIQEPQFITGEGFSTATIDSLLSTVDSSAQTENEENSLSINRLLLDQGTLRLSNKDGTLSNWDNIQFTLKDYGTRLISGSSQTKKGSFRLSGNESSDDTTLSWQGGFNDQQKMKGKLKIQNLDPERMVPALWSDQVKCSADSSSLKGDLIIAKDIQSRSFFYFFENGEAALFNPEIQFTRNSSVKAPAIVLKNFNYMGGKKSIGSFTMENSEISLKVNELANLFTPLLAGGKTDFKSFDMNGSLTIHNIHGKPPLTFNNFYLDTAPHPEDAEKQRVNFKGYTENGGELKAKGNGELSPLALSLSLDFKEIPVNSFLPLLSKSPTAHGSEALISGKGKYSFPQSGYFGSLKVGETTIKDGDRILANWENAKFSKVIFKIAPFSLRVDEAVINRPIFNWDQSNITKIEPDIFSNYLTSLLPIKNLPSNSSRYKYPFYSFKHVKINNGKFQVKDSSTTRFYTNLQANISSLQFPTRGNETLFQFSAKADNGNFNLKGSGDFFKVPTNGKYTFTFDKAHNQDLLTVAQEAGIDINNSKIGGSIATEWYNGESLSKLALDMENVLPIDKNSISGLTLALLYKNSPSISMQFEHLTPSDSNPTPFSQIVLNNFERIKLKAQISPFLLTPDFSDLTDINTLKFRQADSQLTGECREILTRFSELLQTHPLLVLEISSQITQSDRSSLQKKLEEQELLRVEEENDRLFKIWQAKNEEISKQREAQPDKGGEFMEQDLQGLTIEQFTPITPQSVFVTNEILENLVADRMNNITDFLFNDLNTEKQQVLVIEAVDGQKQGIGVSYTTRFK